MYIQKNQNKKFHDLDGTANRKIFPTKIKKKIQIGKK